MLCMCQLSLYRSVEYGGTPAPSIQILLFILLCLGQRSLTLDARRILLQLSLVLKCSPISYMDFLVRLLLSGTCIHCSSHTHGTLVSFSRYHRARDYQRMMTQEHNTEVRQVKVE